MTFWHATCNRPLSRKQPSYVAFTPNRQRQTTTASCFRRLRIIHSEDDGSVSSSTSINSFASQDLSNQLAQVSTLR